MTLSDYALLSNKKTQTYPPLSSQSPRNINLELVKQSETPVIHIIIPVYNEAKGIEKVLANIFQNLDKLYHYRITIIDDCSEDNTVVLINKFMGKFPLVDVNLIQNRENMGKAQSISKGLQCIENNELIVLLDGDGEHSPNDIPSMIRTMLKYDVDLLIGSRFLKYTNSRKGTYLNNNKRFSALRKFGNWGISFLIFLFHHARITDSQCGFRIITSEFARFFSPEFDGFTYETEMTLFAIQNNYKIMEIAIDTGLSSRESHMRIFSDSLKILFVIIYYNFRNWKFSSIYQKLIYNFLLKIH